MYSPSSLLRQNRQSRQSNLTCLAWNNKQSNRFLPHLIMLAGDARRKSPPSVRSVRPPPLHSAKIYIDDIKHTHSVIHVMSVRNKWPRCLFISTAEYIQKLENATSFLEQST
jgi:hypothetical protein